MTTRRDDDAIFDQYSIRMTLKLKRSPPPAPNARVAADPSAHRVSSRA